MPNRNRLYARNGYRKFDSRCRQTELLLYPGYRAAKVDVRIGEFAGVDGESLRFCFDAIVKGSALESLELGIETGSGDELDLSRIEMEELCT